MSPSSQIIERAKEPSPSVQNREVSDLLDKMDLGINAGDSVEMAEQHKSVLRLTMRILVSPVVLILVAWAAIAYIYGREILQSVASMTR